MDKIERAISDKYGLRFIYVDVTDTARELGKKHLNGPATSEILGQGLIAAAFLSSKLKYEKERITFQLKVDGPVRGVLVEANATGGLRGYTEVKLLPDFDGLDNIDIKSVMGNHGTLAIIHSNDRRVIYSGQINVDPPDIRTALAKYFNQSEQVPTCVELYSKMKDFYIDRMTGLMIQKMPGGDTEKFVEILEGRLKGNIKKILGRASAISDFSDVFGVKDLSVLKTDALRFECGCSYEKCVDIMASLDYNELLEIVKKKESQRVTCHFCGETYTVALQDISRVLLEKSGKSYHA